MAYHYGTAQPTSSIAINAGGSIDVSGAGAQGIRVGRFRDGALDRLAAIGADGYRRHTVTVNGAVTSNAEGVYLAGGGKVVIGPEGSIASNSGIAILAIGDTPGADPANDPPIKPKLRVDLNLNGRLLPQVIGDDWIINDGGETAIVVNGVLLHDGATGVVADAVAPNGAWNVTMREEGVNVTDYSDPDPANWMITERAAGIVADRDFSAEDFIEVYAPRAAFYEALPGFLLRLDEGLLSGKRVFSSGSPVWARLSGGRGSYEAAHASVGAQFDYGGFAAEAGLDFSMDENAVGSVSVHRVAGSADVTAPTGGGKIETEGFGVALSVSLNGANAYYARGRFSFADFTSGELGRLATGVGARTHLGIRRRQACGDARRGEPDASLPAGEFGDRRGFLYRRCGFARFGSRRQPLHGQTGGGRGGARPEVAGRSTFSGRFGGPRANLRRGGDERRRFWHAAFFGTGEDPPSPGFRPNVPPRACFVGSGSLGGRARFGRRAVFGQCHFRVQVVVS